MAARASQYVVVTGANKGIGFETVRRLARIEGLHTVMTARNTDRGEAALAKIREEFPAASVQFLELDIADEDSVGSFAKRLKEEIPQLDVLVNNAGIAYRNKSEAPFAEQATETFKVNVYGTNNITKALLPFLSESDKPRVVNVASEIGPSTYNGLSDSLKEEFKSTTDVDAVLALGKKFIDLAVEGGSEAVQSAGWKPTNYGASKLTLIALTRAFAMAYPNIVIASCCPGWCSTDMGTSNAPRSPEEGADTVAWLATEATPEHSGKFFTNRTDKSFL